MGFRDRKRTSGRKENDGKYLRLTGLWPSKNKDTLWTGKFRNQDLGNLIEKCEEADKAGADLVVFLWENTEKESKKDPDFTVQVAVSEDQENGRGRGRSDRGRDHGNEEPEENEENSDDDSNEENKDEEPEEKPSRRSSKSDSSRSNKKEEPKGRRSGAGKKDKNDW